MKINKLRFLLSIIIISSLSNVSYANSDISNIIFIEENNVKIDDILENTSTIAINPVTVNSIDESAKKDIDKFIEQAIANAMKEEEKKLSAEKSAKEKADKEKSELKAAELKVKNDNYSISASDYSDMGNFAKTLLDIPYVYGGSTLKGFDCSGFVKYVYAKFNITIPRTTYTQIKLGKSVNMNDIKEYDLIFFDTRSKEKLTVAKTIDDKTLAFEDIIINESDVSKSDLKLKPTEPTHVGIYIGEGKFIHASSSKKKIVIEDIKGPYFKDRIVDIKRYI
ncbi:hypothetical protein HMPREF9630_00947 [Peptoanaerobacter stomatis]|uniref:NlpC/P60 domain protein n=1 Tax=Peptoanaerobacter stomatis TaxID=796937 RepID=J6HCX6_9FIRM|nr:C40 family peptidase [Peptoanaerobacter stomatis]EHL14904.1 hypothetical protein HMPREF9630_00947 [Peptoanaerobacter stomatis]EJU20613.1 NlpC/P60 domain protein [Peptoanaerobacter stomatis]NWO24997.1 C40 family peptidase [Peptostreptococcaceae bacterium oral taxon 081]NWO25595.1 C40 family peptidase [Peptostreptococcaceae bacterium oral taxon 081]